MATDTPPTFAEALREYGLATVAYNGNPCSETAEVLEKACRAFIAAEKRQSAERVVHAPIQQPETEDTSEEADGGPELVGWPLDEDFPRCRHGLYHCNRC